MPREGSFDSVATAATTFQQWISISEDFLELSRVEISQVKFIIRILGARSASPFPEEIDQQTDEECREKKVREWAEEAFVPKLVADEEGDQQGIGQGHGVHPIKARHPRRIQLARPVRDPHLVGIFCQVHDHRIAGVEEGESPKRGNKLGSSVVRPK